MIRKRVLVFVRSALFLILPTCLATPSFCTTIVIRRSETEACVAADSMVVHRSDRRSALDKCKIGRFGNILFVAAGQGALGDFDVWETARTACAGPDSIWTKADRFGALLETRLLNVLEQLQRDDPKRYTAIVEDQVNIDVGFVAVDNGIIVVRTQRYFLAAFRPEDPPQIRSFPPIDCPFHCAAETLFVLGSSMDSILDSTGQTWLSLDKCTGAQQLVQMVMPTPGYNTGGAVDVVRITNDGAITWLCRKPQCRDDE